MLSCGVKGPSSYGLFRRDWGWSERLEGNCCALHFSDARLKVTVFDTVYTLFLFLSGYQILLYRTVLTSQAQFASLCLLRSNSRSVIFNVS